MASKKPFDKQREINGVLFLAIAIILGVAYYLPVSTSGWLGARLQAAGFGLFGVAAYALPVLTAAMAVDYLLEKKGKLSHRRFTTSLLLLLSTATLLHLTTTDLTAIQQAVHNEKHPAWQALRLLWASGQNPGLVQRGATTLSGGLLGGGAALSLVAVAGTVGSIVLVAALLVSLLILLFNLSLSRFFGRTADALQTTGQKVDRAVRDQWDRHKKDRPAADPASFDLVLDEQPQAAAEPVLEPGYESVRNPRLLASLKKLFKPRKSKPDYFDSDATVIPDDYDDDQGLAPDHQLAQTAPFDVTLVSQASDQRPLPAGIQRVGVPEAGPPLPHAEDEAVSGSREHWTDRSEPVDSERPKAHRSGPGTQLKLDLPYQMPPLSLLRRDAATNHKGHSQYVRTLGQKLEQTLASFGIEAHVVHVTTGPTITRFELSPGPGVKVSRIVSLSDDIALSLAALGVRIEAPIPGKSAIGIEIPNKETQPVLLRGLLEAQAYRANQSPLAAAIGRDVQGTPIICDLEKMPHLLIAGATGSGKSVCINAILMSILFRSSPEQVKMLMIDPKVVELSVYNGIPHLLAPVVTDPKKAANTLTWAVQEMVRRYALFAEKSVRDYNAYRAARQGNHTGLAASEDADPADFENLPLILLVIDELSDLMATSPTEVEDAIARLTAMARAAGIHLIIATQRPSVDVITGVIKANIPSRIAFAVASQVDSRTILDMGGAEKLLGKGDLLYYPQSATKPVRGQGAFVTDAEVEQILTYIKNQHAASYDPQVAEAIQTAQSAKTQEGREEQADELLPAALETVVQTGYGSVSLLQRRLNVGYPRAARLIDALHDQGYIGPFEGSKPRKLLISQEQYDALQKEEPF